MANTNGEIGYFKIGTFVLVGLGLIVFALLIFGSARIFKPIVYVETYFNESIQGISDGTPVKYRGLQIGYVDEIAFTTEIYKNGAQTNKNMYTRSLYVKIAITSKLFTQLSKEAVREFLSKEVAQGLRVKLVAQGLTGTSYLEFDYVDPKLHPMPQHEWLPKLFYVPSVISTLTRLSENAQYIMNELKDIDFKKIFSNVDKLAVSLGSLAGRTDNLLNNIDDQLVKAIKNIKVISDNMIDTSERVKLKPSELLFSSYPPPLDPKKL